MECKCLIEDHGEREMYKERRKTMGTRKRDINRKGENVSCSYFKWISQSGVSHMSQSDYKVQIQTWDCPKFE